MATIAAALQQARALLQSTSDAPDLDVTRLMLHVVKKTEPAWLIAHHDTELKDDQNQFFKELVAERATGKPLAYILGAAEFYGREFTVSPAVLIPRPATELLIDKTLEILPLLHQKLGCPLVIADIGTGSGCIAITVALETLSDHVSHIYATDISSGALSVAKRNIEAYKLQEKITLLEGDMLTPINSKEIDLIISNPPYVPSAELDDTDLQKTPERTGLTFEPRHALDGGLQGHDFIEQLLQSGIPTIYENKGGSITTASLPFES